MIGPHGERDYLEKILDYGCPCTCGSSIEYAMLIEESEARKIASYLEANWLYPNIAVEVEAA